MPFVLNPNALRKVPMKLSISCCRRGERAQLALELEKSPRQLLTHIGVPAALSGKEKTSKSKFNISQIPNSSMHMFVAITSFFVPVKGRLKQTHKHTCRWCFHHECPTPSSGAFDVCFISSERTCGFCLPCLLVGC